METIGAALRAFLASRTPGDERVTLRALSLDDQDEYLSLVQASVSLHHPWMSLASTPEEFRAYVARFDYSTAHCLLVCLRDTQEIVGFVNLNTIIRGRFQNASLSYASFLPWAGKGYMSEALQLVIHYAFEQLSLHRLEAVIQPANRASVALVERLGFRYEGTSPDLLFIDGEWQDHERWALTAPMVPSLPWTPHPTLPAV